MDKSFEFNSTNSCCARLYERIVWSLSSARRILIIWIWTDNDTLYHQVKPFGLSLPSTLDLILPSTLEKDCMDLGGIIWITIQTIWGPPWWWMMIGKGGQCEGLRSGNTTQLQQSSSPTGGGRCVCTHYRYLWALSSVGVMRLTSVPAHTNATATLTLVTGS